MASWRVRNLTYFLYFFLHYEIVVGGWRNNTLSKAAERIIFKNFNENPQLVISATPDNQDLLDFGEYISRRMMSKGISLQLNTASMSLSPYCKIYFVDSANGIP